jgi:disease resistance protein RPM1
MELAVIKPLLSKLGSLLAEEYSLISGVRGDIQFINDELASMQAFLSNLSDSSTDGHDEQTEDWMKQVRDVSYDIEDCIDDFTHGLNPDPRGNDWLTKIRMTLYELRTYSRRRSIASQVVVLKDRAKHVGDRRVRYGVPDPKQGKKRSIFAGYNAAEHQEATRRLIGINKPVGVEAMPELEDWIISDDNKKLGVLSIFGFGGVGKTTAAMSLYRNCGVNFKHHAMVTVSHNTDPDVVLTDILRQVGPQAKDQQGHDSTGSISAKNQTALVPQCMLNFFQKNISKLSQIRLWCSNQEEDDIASNREHARIKGELQKHLGNNRYCVNLMIFL